MKKKDKIEETKNKISSVIHRKDCLPPAVRLRSNYISLAQLQKNSKTANTKKNKNQPLTFILKIRRKACYPKKAMAKNNLFINFKN
jgi:hypothetical protein